MAENTLQVKRGLTTSARLAVVLALGEPCWDTEEGRLYVGDGATLGGVRSVPTEGVTGVQAARLNAVDFRAARPMHQTVKLIDRAHWPNNLEDVLGSGYAANDHHAREGLYILRTATGSVSNSSEYYHHSGFLLPGHTFIDSRKIDIHMDLDFPNPPGGVSFRVGVFVDPDGTETSTSTSQLLGYADFSGTTFTSSQQATLHMRLQSHGHKKMSGTNLFAKRYSKTAVNGAPVSTNAAELKRIVNSSVDWGETHVVSVAILNTAGIVDGVTGTSTSSNYEELRLMNLSAWMTGWSRSN